MFTCTDTQKVGFAAFVIVKAFKPMSNEPELTAVPKTVCELMTAPGRPAASA
jgi:hypothetical protein